VASDLRFVLDTGILVSALLLRGSVPRRAVDHAFASGIVLVSAATIEELDEVLSRPKFNRYVREEERLKFLAAFIRDTTLVDIAEIVTECRDPKDNKFLELALNGNANYIISGDNDLLVLHPFRGISIVTPHDFFSQV
jgi:uncharacterized protein